MSQGRFRANLPLFIGIAVPIIFIGVIAAIAFVPSWFVNPEHDFLYTNGGYDYSHTYRNTYSVSNGHILMTPVEGGTVKANTGQTIEDAPKLYRYSIKDGSVHEVAFSDAEALSLDPGPTSPDGYTVEYRSGYYGFFLFGGSESDSGLYISKGSAGKPLRAIGANPYYYQNNFRLVGWVLR